MKEKIMRINQIAKERPQEVFTSIYHLINKELLKECFNELDGNKVVEIDKITKDEYKYNLDTNLENLVKRLKNKMYKPSSVRKVEIPKANGKVRNLAVANFEDKIVQLALKKIIEAIYEPKFPNNMFGFRPNKSYLDAIRQTSIDIEGHLTSYVLEADIKGYFDNIDHNTLMKYLELHIKDKNILRLINKFLRAGILDKEKFYVGEYGTPQGSILSPVLANIYMYYTLIKWFEDSIKVKYQGFMSIINYADDFICCFQYKSIAELFYRELLPNRLKQAGLEFDEDKTRLIEFGIYAKENISKGKPQTFEFLGFTHYCSTEKNGKFRIKRQTSSKKFRKKLVEFNQWCKENNNTPLYEIMPLVRKKLIGYYNYYGITDNYHMICKFYFRSIQILYKWLNKRSQRRSYNWQTFMQMLKHYKIPKPRITKQIYGDRIINTML